MRTRLFVSLLAMPALTSGWASAQQDASVPAPAEDPAKVAEFQKRFEQGYALEQQGKLAEARVVYDGILADEPNAKRSLLEAGKISIKLNELPKADAYLDKLHALVPEFPEAAELLIQVNEGLGRDVKVARLVKEFHALHDSGKVPDFMNSLCFVREQIHLDQNQIVVVTEYFDYTEEPKVAWMMQLLDAAGKAKRQVVLIYDPEATKAIRAKDPRLADSQEFLLLEDVIREGRIKRIDVYKQIFALPDYKKVRNTMLAILGDTLKPIYSQDVDAPAQ